MRAKIVFTSIELKEKLKGIYQSLRNILSNQLFLYKHLSYLYPPVPEKSLQITSNSCSDPLRNCFSRIFTKTSATKRRKVDVKRLLQVHKLKQLTWSPIFQLILIYMEGSQSHQDCPLHMVRTMVCLHQSLATCCK